MRELLLTAALVLAGRGVAATKLPFPDHSNFLEFPGVPW